MSRETSLKTLGTTAPWDMVIIGGGATGLGAALDSASRGYKTLLVEQYDFAKGTSSRSTKLVHGGVRYLQQGNIKLVREALRERAYLLKNAPHLTSVQPFIVPVYSFFEKCYYAIGLMIYDLLSGKLSLGKTKILSRKKTIAAIPAIGTDKLSGGILYYDGQFDDSRLCAEIAVTAVKQGATILNYCKATGFIKNGKEITGVILQDTLSGQAYQANTQAVINATGVFTDAVIQMDDAEKHPMVSPSQGIHLVVDKSFFPGTNAMMIPKTDDGRVLFAVPWHDHVVLGTTDTPIDAAAIEPLPLEEEIAFIIKHINRYTNSTVERADVKSVYVGLRPLVKAKGGKSTALLSRDHTLVVSPSRLVTITGGKWTTYRKMAEDAVENALFVSKQPKKDCITRTLPIGNPAEREKLLAALIAADPSLNQLLCEGMPYKRADVILAVRNEMAVTVEDVLARRTRILFLDARAAITTAPEVARLMAGELGADDSWQSEQVSNFRKLAEQYLLA